VEEGAVPRSEYVCGGDGEEDWPQSWVGDDGEIVDASTPFLYRRESSTWSDTDYTLTTVSSKFTEDAGGVCGESANSDNNLVTSSENTTDKYIEVNSSSEGEGGDIEASFVDSNISGAYPAAMTILVHCICIPLLLLSMVT
jgi:hypothetical protein